MTIAAGFRCRDGVVLAADTELTFSGGTGKTYGSKMFSLDGKLGCNLTYAGSADYVKELVYDLKQATQGQPWQEALKALKTTYQTYWDANLQHDQEGSVTSILVTLREGKKVHLYLGRGRHFLPVRQYEALGIGSEQAEALFNPLHSQFMTILQARYMAIYALRRVKGFVQGCGGKSEIVEVEDSSDVLSLSQFDMPDIKEIEADFDFFDQRIKPLIFAFSDTWVNKTAFQVLLREFARALKKRRTSNLRKYDRERAEWEELVKASKESSG